MSQIFAQIHSPKIAIVAAKANDVVVSRLVDGAARACAASKIDEHNQTIIRVDGALEIPLALKRAVLLKQFDAFVVLGAIIKGQTDHYSHVARMANDGVLSIAIEHSLFLGNGILTVHTLEQAISRADGPCGNLGFDAARAAINLSLTFFNLEQSKKNL